jgi:hypothetical protein
MASKYSTGIFTPKNPHKIAGNQKITFRSSWEMVMMQFLDSNPSVLQWSSEPFKIPYKNPLTNKNTVYIPDFLVIYQNRSGTKVGELIEIKPKKEAMLESAKSKRDKAFLILNTAKWQAAMIFCAKHGLTFKVITEDQLWPKNGKDLKKK